MKKSQKLSKVIIVHGWRSSPRRGWMGWLARELRQRGYEVAAPHLPEPARPDLAQWIEAIKLEIGSSRQVILIGHSLGTFTLLQVVKSLPKTVTVEKLILVAAYTVEPDSRYWADYHLEEDDFARIRAHIRQSYVIYSNNDHMVLPDITRRVSKNLHADLILDPNQRHFSNLRLQKLPVVLEAVLD